VEYALTRDLKIRTRLYIEYIGPVFDEMVDKIVYTYKFTSLPNIDYLKNDCKVWLTTILNKYDPNRGSAAFSYFSVITKNWFIHKVKRTTLRRRREVNYEDLFKDVESEKMVVQNEYESIREEREFWMNFYSEMGSWDVGSLKENEKKVLEAVKILFESVDDIEIFNKKAIYLYLREITGLNTKQVVNNLKKLREKYRNFKSKWEAGKI
tara:strand:+ start:168 stop:794 length:627 start_codon:yes stop_codon:yes gene_type:complete